MSLVGPPRPGRYVLVWLTLALIPAFTITAFVAHAFREKHHALAIEWERRGDAALRDSKPADAVNAFRNALTFDRENRRVRLQLAQALVAAGHPSEASANLLTLWDAQPGNGPVNLELGRLAAREGDVRGALRYYHNAVEGAWAEGAEAHRRTARLELARFLIARGAMDEAQAELLHLAADMPPDAPSRLEIAGLFLEARLPDRALALYRDILRDDAKQTAAAEGAGLAAFTLGDDVTAERYLTIAVRQGSMDPRVVSTLDTVRQIIAIDPYRRRLSTRLRSARATRAVDRAAARLAGCPEGDARAAVLIEQLEAARPVVSVRRIADEPEGLDLVMELVYTAERFAEGRCGPATALDRALLVISERRGDSGS